MENASKALLIAGGVLFTVLMVTLLLYAFTAMGEYYEEQELQRLTKEITEFNTGYTNYNRKDVLGYELLSLVNKVIDYNQTESTAGAATGSAAGNYGAYSPIKITIVLKNGKFEETDFIRNIDSPDPDGESGVNDLQLLKSNNYIQSDTQNTFKKDILDPIREIENDVEHYGGAEGVKNLVKNITSIYEGKIIDYTRNAGAPTSSWYEADEIVRKYQTLTGITLDDIKRWDEYDERAYAYEYFNAIKAIRDENRLQDISTYYEYTQFQKAKFDCTNVTYNKDTARVETMTFEFNGEIE